MEGYCEENGAHYIGESDTCWRCEVMARRRLKEKLYHAQVDALRLASVTH